jgi:hypothetical protein
LSVESAEASCASNVVVLSAPDTVGMVGATEPTTSKKSWAKL